MINVLILLLLIQHGRQQQASLLDNYGSTLTRINSGQLAILMNGKNLIGLQAQINQLSQQDRVLSAAVYDVGNHILVQSGSAKIPDFGHKEYSQAITLDQNLLGTLSITLDTRWSLPYFYLALIFALACAGYYPLTLLLRQLKTLDITTPGDAPDRGTNQSNNNNKEDKYQHVLAIIKLAAIEKLFSQLSAQSREHQLVLLQNALVKVTALYSGTLSVIDEETLVIDFGSSSLTEASFQAICGTYLLQQAASRQQWLIIPKSVITSRGDHTDITHRIQQYHLITEHHKQSSSLLVEKPLLATGELESRVEFGSDEHPQLSVVAFKKFRQNYHRLLENQLVRILQSEEPPPAL
ncbi:MAG: putative membrane protein affecting hemolysin expression [Cellvibrionaceae bacterium]